MDKRCGTCKYKAYLANDMFHTYPFCTCEEAQLVGWEWHAKIHRIPALKEHRDNKRLACMMIQTGYNELYGKSCPYSI